MHVAIPFSPTFVVDVKRYMGKYLRTDGLVIVHSTVPVGTTMQLGGGSVHSPIRGVHPNLEAGVRTFAKYFGGPRAQEAADIFVAAGIETRAVPLAETTEAAKLWCTTAYGLQILIEKAIHAYCEEHELDFEVVYAFWTQSYNEGYVALGMSHVQRPVLKHVPGRIGGHCVIPNARLLKHWLGDLLVQCDAEMFAEEGVDAPRADGVK